MAVLQLLRLAQHSELYPAAGRHDSGARLLHEQKDFETDQPKLKTVDWFAVAGVILGAIVANLLHWGIASINGMVVAAVCYCVGQAVNKRK